jgi:hypothetical protein
MNATAALLTAVVLGVAPEAAARALRHTHLPEMRMAVAAAARRMDTHQRRLQREPRLDARRVGGADSPNPCAPTDCCAGRYEGTGRVQHAIALEPGRWLATQPLDYVVLVGSEVLWTAAAAREGGFPPSRLLHFETPQQARAWLLRTVQKGTACCSKARVRWGWNRR